MTPTAPAHGRCVQRPAAPRSPERNPRWTIDPGDDWPVEPGGSTVPKFHCLETAL